MKSLTFRKRYQEEITRVMNGIYKIDAMIKALDNVDDKFASGYKAMRAAMWRADRKGTIVEKNSVQYMACQTIGWLNSRMKEEEGEFFLSRRYGYGDIKISSLENREADAMMCDFLDMAGYDIEAIYFLNKKLI